MINPLDFPAARAYTARRRAVLRRLAYVIGWLVLLTATLSLAYLAYKAF